MSITITEALAEIKTIGKRIEKKREFVFQFIGRQDGLKDPLEKDGGSPVVIERERQAIRDLETRIVALRRGVQRANDETAVTIAGTSRSISDWLIWRRDVAPKQREFLTKLRASVSQGRDQARRAGVSVVGPGEAASKPNDFVMNIDEVGLARETENLEQAFGDLDGQLSLKNATVSIIE